MAAPDVIVIGGGIIGLSSAFELARRGLKVRVLEARRAARGATWAAGGMLGATSELTPGHALAPLARASLEAYPAWVEEIEQASGHRVPIDRRGTLLVPRDEAEAEVLPDKVGAAPGVQWLDQRACADAEPDILPAAEYGAWLLERDWAVDNRALAQALLKATRNAGIEVTERCRVQGCEPMEEAVRVTTEDEVLEAGVVVIASGAWAGQLELEGQGTLPVRPVRGQILALDDLPAPRHVVRWSAGPYLVPRGPRSLILGATQEEAGFDNRVTAGGLGGLLARGLSCAPALAGGTVTDSWAGLRPGTPDDLPILGPHPASRRLILATGHFRNGILLSPATARVVGDLVETQAPEMDLTPYALDRFSHRANTTPEPAWQP